MILVTGATGNIGGEVVRLLIERGLSPRLLVRDPAKVAALGDSVEVVKGDLTRPETFEAAFAGVDKAFLVAHAQELPAIAEQFARAAHRAGVRHLVMISSGTIESEPGTTIAGWHEQAEAQVEPAEIPYTFVRPGNFNTNTLSWAGMIRSQGVVYSAGVDNVSSPIDPRDIAAVAAVALVEAGHEGKVYNLTGPALMSLKEQVEIIGKVLGKPVRAVEVPLEGARQGMLKGGLSEELADAILEMMQPRDGAPFPVNSTIKDVTGKEPRTFEQWVRDNIEAFK